THPSERDCQEGRGGSDPAGSDVTEQLVCDKRDPSAALGRHREADLHIASIPDIPNLGPGRERAASGRVVRRVAILGPGAVGGTLAVRLAQTGVDVICVTRADSVAAIRSEGLTLRHGHDVATA